MSETATQVETAAMPSDGAIYAGGVAAPGLEETYVPPAPPDAPPVARPPAVDMAELVRMVLSEVRDQVEAHIVDLMPKSTSYEVAKLALSPGDILVVKLAERMRAEARLRLQEHVRAIIPNGCTAMVLEPGSDVEIVRASAATSVA